MPTQYAAVGSKYNWYSFLDSAGYAIGTAITLANGASSGAGRIAGVQQLGLAVPPARNIAITGDNTLLGAIQIAGDAVPTGNVLTSVYNPTLFNGAQGVIPETVGTTDMDVFGIPCPTFQPMTIISNAPGINQTPGSKGQQGYTTIIWNNITMLPLEETQITDATAHQFTNNVLGTYSSTKPWGASIATSTNGATAALGIRFFNTYPFTIYSFKGDGTIVTVTLDETPYANVGAVFVWVNGAPLVEGSGAGKFQNAAKVVTFGTAPVAGAKVVVGYYFVPVC